MLSDITAVCFSTELWSNSLTPWTQLVPLHLWLQQVLTLTMRWVSGVVVHFVFAGLPPGVKAAFWQNSVKANNLSLILSYSPINTTHTPNVTTDCLAMKVCIIECSIGPISIHVWISVLILTPEAQRVTVLPATLERFLSTFFFLSTLTSKDLDKFHVVFTRDDMLPNQGQDAGANPMVRSLELALWFVFFVSSWCTYKRNVVQTVSLQKTSHFFPLHRPTTVSNLI